LTASEIGTFVFCPEAWYLQRNRASVTVQLEQFRLAGIRRHRRIGRRTDLIRMVEALRAALLVVILLVLILAAALVLKALG
jgi:hypothetical protein